MTNTRDEHNNVVSIDFDRASARKAVSSNQDHLQEQKRQLFAEWLSHGMVCVLLDARSADVKVPPEFKHQGDLRLNFCYKFHIADFNFNEVGVWASLSFDSGEFFCMVPWKSVYSLQSSVLVKGAVWFDNFPKDYDPAKVLGLPEEEDSEQEAVIEDNIIAFDFSDKKLS